MKNSGKSSDVTSEQIARLASGDNDAMKEIVRCTKGSLHRYLQHKLPGEDAEDVLQDVYLTVWRRAASYCPSKGHPRSWIVTIARNRAIDYLRGRGSRRRTKQHYTFVRATYCKPSQESSALLNHVSTTMQGLPDRERGVTTMALVEGYSMTEISNATGLPLGTVKSRVRNGKRRLRCPVPAKQIRSQR
jgi:RNA polymerase sigma-70 factor (ECF subfamily)